MGGLAIIAPLLPTIIPLLADLGKRFTGDKGDRIVDLIGGALKGGAQELAAIEQIKAMKERGWGPTDAELMAVIDQIDRNTDRINAAADKAHEGG